MVLNDTKLIPNADLGTIWYHSEPLDIPYFPNQFLGWDFFCHFLQQDSSSWVKFKQRMILYISSICNTDFALRIVSLSLGTLSQIAVDCIKAQILLESPF
jgi:hypothetical protein